MPKALLILDDDVNLARAIQSEFLDHGYKPSVAQNTSEIPDAHFDYAIVDVRLVGEFGLSAIEKIKKRSPNCKVVVLSGYSSITSAVEAVKRGAINYLVKPASFTQLENALLERVSAEKTEFKAPSLSQIENEYIDYILIKNGGNISKSAKELGIRRQSLQRKLKKYS